MEAERRKAPRKTPAEFTFIKLEQEFGGRVLNCSEDGLCFETMSPINESDLIQFWFSLHTLERVEGFGQIVWMNQAKNVGGIRITHLSRTSRLKFQGWLGDPAQNHEMSPRDGARATVASPVTAAAVDEPLPAQVTAAPVHPVSAPISSNVPVEQAIASDAAIAGAAVPGVSQARHWPTSVVNATSPHSPATSEERASATAEHIQAYGTNEAPESQSPPASAPLWLQGTTASADRDDFSPAMTTQPEPPENLKWTAPLSTEPFSPEASNPWPSSHPESFSPHSMASSEDQTQSFHSSSSLEYSDEPAVEPRELVPLTRHRNATRMQFIRGALLGILACAAIAAMVSKYSRPVGPSVAAQVSSLAATGGTTVVEAQPSSEAPSSNLRQAVSIPSLASISHTIRRASTPPVTTIIPGILQQSSLSPATASATDPAPAPEQVATQNEAQAPAASSAGNAVTAYHPAPLIEAPTLPIPPAPFRPPLDPRLGPTATEPARDTEAAVSYPSFHRQNPVSTLQVGGEVRPARLIRSVQAVYPLSVRNRGISGDVVIDAVVTASGNVTQARVLSGPTLLHQAALDAASQMKYEPALLDGKPTSQHVTITMKFRPE